MNDLNQLLNDLFEVMFELSSGELYKDDIIDQNEINKILCSNSAIHVQVALLQSLIDEYIVTRDCIV